MIRLDRNSWDADTGPTTARESADRRLASRPWTRTADVLPQSTAGLLGIPQTAKLNYGQEDSMIQHDCHFIDGRWQPSIGTERIDVFNAAT